MLFKWEGDEILLSVCLGTTLMQISNLKPQTSCKSRVEEN